MTNTDSVVAPGPPPEVLMYELVAAGGLAVSRSAASIHFPG